MRLADSSVMIFCFLLISDLTVGSFITVHAAVLGERYPAARAAARASPCQAARNFSFFAERMSETSGRLRGINVPKKRVKEGIKSTHRAGGWRSGDRFGAPQCRLFHRVI